MTKKPLPPIMPWNNQHQHQGQHEHQDQHQGQGQGQHEYQKQGQGQHQNQTSENHNANGNGNGNLNGNANGNLNGNANLNYNEANNAGDNTANNTANNHNDTTVTTTVTTDVAVTSSLDLSDYMPTDDDFADIDLKDSPVENILMAQGDVSFDPGNELNMEDFLDNALNGAGNDSANFNGQSNNLVDNDTLEAPTVGGTLTQTNTSTGGTATSDDGIDAGSEDGEGGGWFHGGHGAKLIEVDDGQDEGEDDDAGTEAGNWGSGNGDDGFVSGESLASAASAIDTTAFNQSIVMGANVLGNTVDMSVVGGNFSSTYVGDDSSDGA